MCLTGRGRCENCLQILTDRKFCKMLKFVLILAIKSVYCDEIFTSTYSVTDQCISLCKENELPLLDLVSQKTLNFFFKPNFCRKITNKLFANEAVDSSI